MIKKSSVGGRRPTHPSGSQSALPGAAPELPKQLDVTWMLNTTTQCFERLLGGRRFVFVNGRVYSFDADDVTYMDFIFDQLDPKYGPGTSDRDEEGPEHDAELDPELFPGGIPDSVEHGWYFDDDTKFFMRDLDDDKILVFNNGEYIHFACEDVVSGKMQEDLHEISTAAIMEEEQKMEDNFHEQMWGLDDEDFDTMYVVNGIAYGQNGVIEGGYDVEEDLKGLKEDP